MVVCCFNGSSDPKKVSDQNSGLASLSHVFRLCVVQGKFQPVEQVVKDEEFPGCTRLLSCTRSLSTLHHVAEEKGKGC